MSQLLKMFLMSLLISNASKAMGSDDEENDKPFYQQKITNAKDQAEKDKYQKLYDDIYKQQPQQNNAFKALTNAADALKDYPSFTYSDQNPDLADSKSLVQDIIDFAYGKVPAGNIKDGTNALLTKILATLPGGSAPNTLLDTTVAQYNKDTTFLATTGNIAIDINNVLALMTDGSAWAGIAPITRKQANATKAGLYMVNNVVPFTKP